MKHSISAKIITYNRSRELARTLAVWGSTDLVRIPLEVLDNCGTDDTAAVVEKAGKTNPNLTYRRHALNIGVSGNILRAYESFRSDYCWLICDDDIINKDSIPELLSALEQDYDVLLVADLGRTEKDFGFSGSTREYIQGGGRFFYSASFIPGFIFKRKFITDDTMYRSYKAASTLFPYAVIIEKVAESNAALYSLPSNLIERKPNEDTYTLKINWLLEAFKSGAYLREFRDYWNQDFIDEQKAYFGRLTIVKIAFYRANGLLSLSQGIFCVEQLWPRFKVLSMLFLFFAMIPKSIFSVLRRLRKGKQGQIGLETNKRL